MVDISKPKSAAATPLLMEPPLNEPTIVRPNKANMKISGDPNDVIIGVIIGRDTAKTIAPKTPPKADTVKAAPKALAACPFFARG